MPNAGDFGVEWTGLRELHAQLKQAGHPDDAIKDAMQNAGALIQREAFRLVPMNSGTMAKTIKVNRAKNLLRVTVGNNTTVRYAYTFHAVAMGKSRGGFTFNVPAGKGRQAYKRQARIPNNPFMFKAAERKQREVLNSYVDAIGELLKRGTP